MGGYIKQQLEQLGIKVTLETPDRSAAIKQIYTDRAFDLSVSNNASYADPMMRTSLLYTSDNVGKVFRNAAGYKNPEVDGLLQRALFEVNEDARARILNEFQRIVMEDLPVLPIAWKGNVMIYNKKVQNVAARPEVQYDTWKDLWIE
jgi:peptide/nickel transport system substrate-binding protein